MAISEFHMPFNYYLSLFSSSLWTPLDLALAGQPLALYCTFSLDRSKPVTEAQGAFERNTSVTSPNLLPMICSITMGCYWTLEV